MKDLLSSHPLDRWIFNPLVLLCVIHSSLNSHLLIPSDLILWVDDAFPYSNSISPNSVVH